MGGSYATQDLEFLRAGCQSRLGLEEYYVDIDRIFACGRLVANHRTIRFTNITKAWSQNPDAPALIKTTTISVSLFDDEHRVKELWQVTDGFVLHISRSVAVALPHTRVSNIQRVSAGAILWFQGRLACRGTEAQDELSDLAR